MSTYGDAIRPSLRHASPDLLTLGEACTVAGVACPAGRIPKSGLCYAPEWGWGFAPDTHPLTPLHPRLTPPGEPTVAQAVAEGWLVAQWSNGDRLGWTAEAPEWGSDGIFDSAEDAVALIRDEMRGGGPMV